MGCPRLQFACRVIPGRRTAERDGGVVVRGGGLNKWLSAWLWACELWLDAGAGVFFFKKIVILYGFYLLKALGELAIRIQCGGAEEIPCAVVVLRL